MAEGDAATRVEAAALADVNGRVAVELPAGVAVLGKKKVAAGPQLEPPSDRHADLPAQAPGVVLEVAPDSRPDGDRAVDQ